jgi:hypothetical protein
MELGVGAHFKKWEKAYSSGEDSMRAAHFLERLAQGHIYQGNESMRKLSVLFCENKPRYYMTMDRDVKAGNCDTFPESVIQGGVGKWPSTVLGEVRVDQMVN